MASRDVCQDALSRVFGSDERVVLSMVDGILDLVEGVLTVHLGSTERAYGAIQRRVDDFASRSVIADQGMSELRAVVERRNKPA